MNLLYGAVIGGIIALSGGTAAAGTAWSPGSGDRPRLQSSQPSSSASFTYKETVHNARTYVFDNDMDKKKLSGGVLFAGRNYFYCQARGPRAWEHGKKSDWWLLTDDDHGKKGVWVSAVYVAKTPAAQKVPGVRECSP